MKYLVECTQKLVRKYITKYGTFRLTSIRYPIMKYLIKSHQESLIKHILNKKINERNSNIYIPRSYKWVDKDNNRSTTEISKSDLHHAILRIQNRGDSTVILKYLIDYYADNTKEYDNHVWMFTVSKAIPLLYEAKLSKFVQYLFKKPCFGITEAYTPPLHIDPYDQMRGNDAFVIRSLAVKPHLASKLDNTLWLFLKRRGIRLYNFFQTLYHDHNNRRVYIVPLPDFTVYPEDSDPNGHQDHSENNLNHFWFLFALFRKILFPRRKVINNTKKMSPFLHVIHEEKGYEIYRTPSIIAVLDFKWLAARHYFIRHIILYLLYNISFSILLASHSFKGFKIDSNITLTIWLIIYFYTGWYLIVTEFVQLKREGRRYMNIFNMFDLLSVLLPFSNNVAFVLYYYQVITFQIAEINTFLAITTLVMWLELILLLRYFEYPARFIYIIKSILLAIWPFFVFMLIAVIAFGHAMFILINRDDLSLQIPTYKIEDTSNPDLYSNITIKQEIDRFSRLDNYYSNPLSAIEAVFFWTNGRWDQLNQWDNYAVDVMSILGSVILVLILQNMLIAFMNGAFDKANEAGRTVAYKHRAELVAEYEVLERYFGNRRGNPQYIYYIPDPDMIDAWLTEIENEKKQKLRLMDEDLAELSDFDYSDCDDDNCDVNDDDDDDDQDNSSYSKKNQNEGSLSTMDLDSVEPSTTKNDSTIDKISFIDEEIFLLKIITSKLNRKSQRNRKSNDKLLKNAGYNKSSNEPLSEDPGHVDDQLSMQERFNNLENELKTRLDQNLKTILETLNNLNNPK